MKQAATLDEVLATGGCRDRDLSGFDFEQVEDDQELEFENCELRATRIKGDVLIASKWTSCAFLDCEFAGASLRGAEFLNCSFFAASSQTGAEFRLCDMSFATFAGCNLSLAVISGCDGYNVTFKDCKLLGAQIERMDFSRKLGRKTLNTAAFTACTLENASLADLDLTSADFNESDLTGADLRGARLVNAKMTGGDLSFAQVDGADFSGADLTGSRLQDFCLTDLKAYASMTVPADQQHVLLNGLGIEVSP